MQSDTAVDDVALVELRHVRVHLRPHQAEGDGLVAHQRLIVRFGVADVLLVPPAVQQPAEDGSQAPVLIPLLFEDLDPVVRHAHSEAVVEAEPALLHRPRHPGHPGHVLRNRDGSRLEGVKQLVGEH